MIVAVVAAVAAAADEEVRVAKAAARLRNVLQSSAGGVNVNISGHAGGSSLRFVTHPGIRMEVIMKEVNISTFLYIF